MSKPSFPRSRRINAIIQEVLAEEVERLTDPRIGLASITGVDVAPDFRRAIVFVSALDQSHIEETINGLEAAAPRLRTLLGQQVHFKYTPELEFRPDAGIVQGERTDALLRELKHEDAAHPADPDV